MDNFVEMSMSEMEYINGGGIFEDAGKAVGYAVGYVARGAVDGVKVIGSAAKEAVNPYNYIQYATGWRP